jgi:hypothetical protein
MRTLSLARFLTDAEKRAAVSGVSAIPVNALRNKGGNRTATKRRLLDAAGQRAKAAGIDSVPAYF